MRFFSVLLAGFLIMSTNGWETDFEAAKQKAKTEHKLILVSFSGSDWCVPCIRLHKDLLEQPAFVNFADSNLVMVKADFPRLKKNQLARDQQRRNEQLAELYNPRGIFPLTLLLDPEGKILRSWEGNPELTPVQFIGQIKAVGDGAK
jgi:thioredoxin-related protein